MSTNADPVTPDGAGPPENGATPTDEKYAPVLFTDDALPAAGGKIAKLFQAVNPEKQRHDAQAFYTFLKENKNPLRLNVGRNLLSALLIVPDSSQVTLIYGLGFGTADIGTESTIADKFLALSGEGSATLGPPDLRVLPPSLSETKDFLSPTDDEIKDALTQRGPNFGPHLIAPRLVRGDNKESLLRIAPIPAYFVLDGFEHSLDAAMVYERLLACTHESDMLTHARSFLRTALVGPFRANDDKPFVAPVEWAAMPPSLAKEWRQDRISALFPSLFPANPPATTPTTPALTPSPVPTEFFTNLFREFKASITTDDSPSASVTKGDSTGSEFEKRLLKKMCGQQQDCDDSVLPSWYSALFAKNQDRKDKDHIVAELLTGNSRFEDVDIPIYPELKKMILERNWVGGEAGGSPKYAYACYGISPFAMLDLSEDQIADMEFTAAYLHASSSIAPSDIKSSKAKLLAKVPECSTKWLQILKRFTNLLFLVFSPSSPLYRKCLEIVKALWEYPSEVVAHLPQHAKASILWILHLQSRHFAQGKMVPDAAGDDICLPAFSQMYHSICSSNVHLVSVAGLPSKLTSAPPPDKKKRQQPTGEDDADTSPTKKQKKQEEQQWHPRLKAALAEPLRIARSPGINQIKGYCGLADGDPVLPDCSARDCRHYLLLGCCRYGATCKFKHGTATDAQATAALAKLEKFISAPDGLRGNNN